MIVFKDLTIENYLSITNLQLNYKNGIINLTGENGSGKTSTLTALQMCLFNKNMRNTKGNIEDAYNKHTGLPYKITCTFLKNDVVYSITNDRNINQITILQNGANISPKGIKGQLAKLEDILGLDFQTFSSLTFISQSTLMAIFDLTSSENLLYRFLDIDLLTHIEKHLKSKQNDLKKHANAVLSGISAINAQQETLRSFERVDTDALRQKQAYLQEALLLLNEDDSNTKLTILREVEGKLRKELNTLRENYIALKTKVDILKDNLEALTAGTCPTCGQSVEDISDKHRKELEGCTADAKKHAAKGKKIEEELDTIIRKIRIIQSEISEKKQSLLSELNEIKGRLLVVEDQQKNFEKVKSNIDKLEEQKAELLSEYKELSDAINFCASALGVIKSGAVTKEYVQNFVRLLNTNIADLCSAVDLKIAITAIDKKGSVDFEFVHKGVAKTYNDLSSGEKTKCSLICLFAVLDTLEFLTETSVNLLCLDEILSVVDKQGLELFKILLNKYREQKSIFLVSHHNEIASDFFDENWTAKIINNTTTLEIV